MPQDHKNVVGNFIVSLREAKYTTPELFAQKIGVSEEILVVLEQGKMEFLTEEIAQSLFEITGFSVDDQLEIIEEEEEREMLENFYEVLCEINLLEELSASGDEDAEIGLYYKKAFLDYLVHDERTDAIESMYEHEDS